LLRHADVVLDRLAVAERDIADLLAGRRDRLTIGTFQSASVRVLPNAIRALRVERPDVEITLFEDDDIRELVRRLVDGELALTFIVGPYADERLAYEWFGPDPFVLLSPAGAPAAPIAPVDLQDLPLVGWQPSPCQLIIDEALRTHGVSPRYVFRSTDNGAVQAMVRAGMGHAVLPVLAIERDDPGIVVRNILPAIPDRLVGIARRADATTSAAATRFVEVARDAFAHAVAP
jgi:DNA-binding transcriptional LysR family regulator